MLGVDVAGIIEPLGPGIDDRLHVGDAVIAFVVPMGPHGGTRGEQVVVEGVSVVRAPLGAAMVLAVLRVRATRHDIRSATEVRESEEKNVLGTFRRHHFDRPCRSHPVTPPDSFRGG